MPYATKEKESANKKQYYKKNQDELVAYRRKYYTEHRDEIILRERERYYRDVEASRATARKNYHHNRAFRIGQERFRLYGLTPERHKELVDSQNGLCAICGEKPTDRFGLCVDHDHDTGQVRGLLCNNCNRAIGLLGDNIPTLTKAIHYIEQHLTKTDKEN